MATFDFQTNNRNMRVIVRTKIMAVRNVFFVILTLCGVLSSLTSCTAENDNPAPVVVTDDKPFSYDQYIDASVRPGDNFYQYALGKWLDDASLPSLQEMASTSVSGYREQVLLHSDDPVVSAIRQMVAEAENDGSGDMALFRSRLDMVSSITSQADLLAAFSQLCQWGYKPLLRQVCAPEAGCIIPVLTSEYPPNPLLSAFFFKDLDDLSTHVHNICSRLSILGFSEERIEEIYQHAMEIETLEMDAFDSFFNLCRMSMPTRAATRGAASPSLQQYCELIGVGDLAEQIQIGYNTESTQVFQELIDLLFAGTDKSIATMRDYLMYFITGLDFFFLPQLTPQLSNYWRMSEAIYYVSYYRYRLDVETCGKEAIQKAKCNEIMENLRAVLIERIEQLDWMTSATKQEALKKARKMMFCIGYPDQWNDEFTPIIEGATLLEAVTSLRRQSDAYMRQLVGRQMQTHAWDFWCTFCDFVIPNAFYNYNCNQLLVLPAFLMPPCFDIEQSEAALYANATLFAHEICHGFDVEGANYDENGDYRDWWTAEDRAVFKQKQQQMTALWNQLEFYPGQPADGERTLAENMADYGGVTLTFNAYSRRLKEQGFSGQQYDEQLRKYWLSYAYLWSESYERNPEELKRVYQYDVHSVGHNRVNGIARLFDEWYRLFDVRPTDKLYLPPADRVRIW